MALVTLPNTFTVGAVIVASQHNSNFSTIYSDYNGNIDNTNIAASAAIVDTKLAQISTASKVSGAALTSLGSIPTGGGTIPAKNGGTGGDMSAATVGADPYFSATGVMAALAAGTSGQVKISGGGAAPTWGNALSGVLDYGTSGSSSTARQATAIKVAYGTTTAITAGSTFSLTNLTFTSSSTYVVMASIADLNTSNGGNIAITYSSGSAFVITNNENVTHTVRWFAWGT